MLIDLLLFFANNLYRMKMPRSDFFKTKLLQCQFKDTIVLQKNISKLLTRKLQITYKLTDKVEQWKKQKKTMKPFDDAKKKL